MVPMTKKLLLPAVLALVILALAPALTAGSLKANLIAMFPKNVSEFAYADLAEARKSSWFPQFKSQSLPPRFTELEQFLASAGVNPTQVEELAWALVSADEAPQPPQPDIQPPPPETKPTQIKFPQAKSVQATPTPTSTSKLTPTNNDQLIGLALGSFDPGAATASFKARKLRGFQDRGFTLYSCGSPCSGLYVTFLDSSTIAFGPRHSLERLIEVRSGAADSILQNDQMFSLINQANGRGLFWGVLNSAGTRRALRRLVPEAATFPQADKLLAKLTALSVTIEGSSDLAAHLRALTKSPDDSVLLAQLLQGVLLYRQFQSHDQNPALAPLLDSVRISPNGPALEVSLTASNNQILNLIEHDGFVSKR